MITLSPIRALDSDSLQQPQTARLFRLKPFENTIRLVEQPPGSDGLKEHRVKQQQQQVRSASAPMIDTAAVRKQAVRLLSSVRHVVRDRLLGGEEATHLWAWFLFFMILLVGLLIMCVRLQTSLHTVERRFEVLLGLVSNGNHI